MYFFSFILSIFYPQIQYKFYTTLYSMLYLLYISYKIYYNFLSLFGQ